MKTAVSIPDPLFTQADELARRRRVTRSALYAEALQLLLESHRADDVTARLDAIYDDLDHGVDAAITAVNAALLEERW